MNLDPKQEFFFKEVIFPFKHVLIFRNIQIVGTCYVLGKDNPLKALYSLESSQFV